MNTFRVGSDVTVLADHMEVPGLGFLPINAFVLHAKEPVVVDTGLSLRDRDFMATLRTVIDPPVGALDLPHPPRPRPHRWAVPAARRRAAGAPDHHLRWGGDHVDGAGAAARPPVPPQPRPEPRRRRPHAARVPPAALRQRGHRRLLRRQVAHLFQLRLLRGADCRARSWPAARTSATCLPTSCAPPSCFGPRSTVPWVHTVDQAVYMKTVRTISDIDCATVLSTHLPPAIGIGTQLEAMLAAAPSTDPFVGPDQEALEAMLASFQPVAAAP